MGLARGVQISGKLRADNVIKPLSNVSNLNETVSHLCLVTFLLPNVLRYKISEFLDDRPRRSFKLSCCEGAACGQSF